MNLDQLTDQVLRRLLENRPKALLVGQRPEGNREFLFVREPPYSAVVIGQLPPEELLRMPSGPVCEALLGGMPVWICPQSFGRGRHGVLLRRELMEAEHRLILFGAKPMKGARAYDGWNGDRESVGDEKM